MEKTETFLKIAFQKHIMTKVNAIYNWDITEKEFQSNLHLHVWGRGR